MASSGWQGERTLYNWGSCSSLTFNLRVDSITHIGNTVSVTGVLRFIYHNSCGGTGYYNYTMSATPAGGSTVSYGTWSSKSDGYYQDRNISGSFSASASSSSGNFNVGWSSNSGNNGTATWNLSFDTSGNPPSGGYATYHSSTWNSVTFTTGVSSTGGMAIQNHASIITGTTNGAADTINTWDAGRREFNYNGKTDSSHKFTGSDSTTSATYMNPINIKGLLHYKLGWWIGNDAGYTAGYNNTLRYLPPAPLQSITYTQTQGSTNVTVNLTITGGNSTNNYTDNVTTHYRYSTNGGSSYSTWAQAGSAATPWTARTASFTCPYGANVVVQAKQTYHSMDSETKSISFTATSGTAPSGGSLSVTASTWNTVTLAASNVSYGNPSSVSGRKLAIGVSYAPNSLAYKLENQVNNVTGATTTVTNSSIHPGASALTLKGMLPVYGYIWAWNTVTSSTVVHLTTPYYLPPAPGIGSYTNDGGGDYTIKYTGSVDNNVADYTESELKRTVRYKIDNGAWVYIDNNVQKTIDAITSQQISVPPQSTATVESWLTYRGKDSEVTTFTITNTNRPVHFYGSVNGLSKEVKHLYGSVNGETVKIVKMYGSVGGVATEVFEDV